MIMNYNIKKIRVEEDSGVRGTPIPKIKRKNYKVTFVCLVTKCTSFTIFYTICLLSGKRYINMLTES